MNLTELHFLATLKLNFQVSTLQYYTSLQL